MNYKRIRAKRGTDTLFFKSIIDAAVYFKTSYTDFKMHINKGKTPDDWELAYVTEEDNPDEYISVTRGTDARQYKKKSRFKTPLVLECRYDEEFTPNICPFCGLVGIRWEHIKMHIDGRPFELVDRILRVYDYEKIL